ncbi:MAG: glycogen-binding domain-containing protein [Gemmatimonadaceae bacterium]
MKPPGRPQTIIRLVAFSALLVSARAALAQRTQTALDIGGMALRYADTVNTGAVAITGDASYQSRGVVGEALGTFSQFFTGGASAQGVLSGSYFVQSGSRVITELAAFAGGSAHHDGTRTGQALGNLRVHYQLLHGELFGGIGVGRSSFGDGVQNVLIGEAGGSTQIGAVDASLTLSPVSVDSARYADTQAAASWTHSNLDLSALAGFRFGDQLERLGGTARAWGSVSMVAWFRPAMAAVLSAGTYPIDPTQGFPGGKFASASVRFTRRNRRASTATTTVAQIPATVRVDSSAIEAFSWDRVDPRKITLKTTARLARTVEVSADFTGWQPVPLASVGNGEWTITLPVAAGQYQMNLRIDGGRWLVPPGLLPMVDEFGGAVGLLIVD